MDPRKLNPAEKTVAEADYEKKFSRKSDEAKNLKEQEAAPKAEWKTLTKEKADNQPPKKGSARFTGRHAGKLKRGSAFVFVIGLILGGVWYTSVLAPNILLVNVKEMYTNDLADATTALEIYTQIMYYSKIGPTAGQGCEDTKSIECKLTTMSRSQKQAFERQGFQVIGTKVTEDNRDDGNPSNDLPVSRYKVTALIPPNYKQTVDSAMAAGNKSFSDLISGNGNVSSDVSNALTQLLNPLKSAASSPQNLLEGILKNAPITSGPQLWIYSQLSTATKEQVYSVFNPRSSFFTDARFKQRIKTRYNMTKDVTVSGNTEADVNSSFDSSVQKADDGLDPLTGQVNQTNGISLASLSSPLNLTQLKSLAGQLTSGVSLDTVKGISNQLPEVADLESAGNLLATNTYSYTDLMCSWYTIGEMATNALTRAKASTAARYALQYLKAADSIKAGTADEEATNVLASKLAQNTTGGYNGGSATDSLTYRSITYGDSIPSSIGSLTSTVFDAALIIAYNLSAYENIGTLAASWAQVIPNAAALGAITGASGSLLSPPANVGGSDRQYCLSGETTENKTAVKGTSTEDTKCTEAVTALAPVGMQAAVSDAAEVGRRTCPPVNAYDDNLIQLYLGTWRGPVSNTMLPSQKIAQLTLTPYIAGWFGINSMVIAAATQQLYTSNVTGLAANYALFSGMGELLGDMAESRGLMPSNAADMEAYLNLGEIIGGKKDQDEIAQAAAKKNPFDPYNKFSFVGSIANSLAPSTTSGTPLFATLSNVFSLVGSGAQTAISGSSAKAFYHSQPSLITTSAEETAERQLAYGVRLSSAGCPVDLQYLAIGITPDIMCNVRYSMPLDDIGTALNLSGVLDYMTQSHPEAYDSQIQELNERIAKADAEGNKEYLQTQLDAINAIKDKPFIDKDTGKPTAGNEYDKYLQYCVNRADPWGRSAVSATYKGLSDSEKAKRQAVKSPNGDAITTNDPGSPYQMTASGVPTMAVTATQRDQDWYTGKNCTRLSDDSSMVQYFRVYTTLCSVDGSMSATVDCTEPDSTGDNYTDPYYLDNDILYTSWY